MSDEYLDGLSYSILREFACASLGDKIGEGMSRTVYEYALDITKIVKIESRAGFFQNVIEWETWNNLRDTKHSKWLAPCRYISPSGTFLIMDRSAPLRIEEAPMRLPSWLGDHKLANYGLINKQVVCHDYGTNKLLNNGAFTARLKKTSFYK
jgi:hypothetical protein